MYFPSGEYCASPSQPSLLAVMFTSFLPFVSVMNTSELVFASGCLLLLDEKQTSLPSGEMPNPLPPPSMKTGES